MYLSTSRNHDWFWGVLWTRWTGLEIQLGPIGLWLFPGTRPKP